MFADHMEIASAIILASILLVGGGATGALVVADGQDWMGFHHGGMMGSHGDGYEDCPGYDGDHLEDCHEGGADHPEECEEHYEEDCPYHDEGGHRSRGGDCC